MRHRDSAEAREQARKPRVLTKQYELGGTSRRGDVFSKGLPEALKGFRLYSGSHIAWGLGSPTNLQRCSWAELARTLSSSYHLQGSRCIVPHFEHFEEGGWAHQASRPWAQSAERCLDQASSCRNGRSVSDRGTQDWRSIWLATKRSWTSGIAPGLWTAHAAASGPSPVLRKLLCTLHGSPGQLSAGHRLHLLQLHRWIRRDDVNILISSRRRCHRRMGHRHCRTLAVAGYHSRLSPMVGTAGPFPRPQTRSAHGILRNVL